MTRTRLVSLVLAGIALTAACVLNPQPIPPEDLAAAADASGKRDSTAVEAIDDGGASQDAGLLSPHLDAAVDAPLDASTDAPTDASDDGG